MPLDLRISCPLILLCVLSFVLFVFILKWSLNVAITVSVYWTQHLKVSKMTILNDLVLLLHCLCRVGCIFYTWNKIFHQKMFCALLWISLFLCVSYWKLKEDITINHKAAHDWQEPYNHRKYPQTKTPLTIQQTSHRTTNRLWIVILQTSRQS